MVESDNPTPEQGQEGQPQVPDLSGLLKDGKILGKYDTPEALEAGYWNSVQEMNKVKDQLGMAMQVIQALQTGQPQQQQPTVRSYEKNLESMGIPINDLIQLVEDRAKTIAGEVVHKKLNPMVTGANARTYMDSAYSDYAPNEQNIMRNVKNNPALAKRFDDLLEAGQPEAALELGYFHWKNSAPPKPDPSTVAAKIAAGGTAGSGSIGRTSGIQSGPTREEQESAIREFQNGNPMPLFDLKLKGVPLTYSEQMEALMRGRT